MPAIAYKNKAGDRIPSVTTILAQWGIKTQPLLYWAWKQGEAGIPLYEKKEAEVGTIAHMMIEADIKGKETDLSEFSVELLEQANICYENFKTWKSKHNFEPIDAEVKLISEEHQFGGTIDCVARIDGKLAIPDWKTGKEIYSDHILQIIAYEHLWNENFPDHPITGGYHILRTGKEIAMFDYRWYGEFPKAWKAFLLLRELYDLDKYIKKLK